MSFRFPVAGARGSPSTPNAKNKNTRSLFSQPSTTPKAAPPSYMSLPSTTPLGPPPRSSIFGSSKNAPNTFKRKGNTPARRGFTVPGSSPPRDSDEDDEDESDEEAMDVTGVVQNFAESLPPIDETSAFLSSIMSEPRGLKRSRNGEIREQGGYIAIAKSFTDRTVLAELREDDDVVIKEEDILSRLDAAAASQPKDLHVALSENAAQVTALWNAHADSATKEAGIGPAADGALSRANYVASLLLSLHHPYSAAQADHAARTHTRTPATRTASTPCPLPRALLNWLDLHHHPFPDDFSTIHLNSPSPSEHDRFWDTVYASLVRGRFDRVIRLLRDAGWEHAITADDDNPSTQAPGYTGRQLDNIEEVVDRCVRLLEACPARKEGDWDVKGPAWTIFRQRVRLTLNELESFAGETEEDDEDAEPQQQPNVFRLSRTGGDSMSLSRATRKAESKVPWTIYENLKLAYGLLLGNTDELIDASQDWLEASIYLTVWWDGDTGTTMRKSASHMKPKTREVDLAPGVAYRRHLAEAFAIATESDEAVFQPDSLDEVQVAVACVMQEGVEGAIAILRGWSLSATVAVVDIAAVGGWLPTQTRPRSAGGLERAGWSSEDLMVLSHGPGQKENVPGGGVDRDGILIEYADALAGKAKIGKVKEGWELAVSVLGRLDNASAGQQRVGELLEGLELEDEGRVERVLKACGSLGLGEQARGVAERYADHLASDGTLLGSILLYYSRAHAAPKLKAVLAQLTSTCLVHSAPSPQHSSLDPQLDALLSNERPGLVSLAQKDPDAATLLSGQLSGYATLRRFYELRDQDSPVPSLANERTRTKLAPSQRRRTAAAALTSVLESASDCIRGGLFDREVEDQSAVPVEGVLVLLGEALPLLGHEKRVFTKEQVWALLRIVEDYDTAPGRIKEGAERLLTASLAAFREDDAGVTKSTGGLGGSSYDMLGSAMSIDRRGDGDEESKTAWDWRHGLDAVGGVQADGKMVVGLLRLALAKEVGKGWAGMGGW